MKLMMCNCSMCRHGRKNSYNQYYIKHKRSAYRSKVRRMLKAGQYENLPERIPIGYTD